MDQNGIKNGEEFVEATDYEGNAFQYICREGDVRELLESVQSMRCTDVLYQYDVYGRQPTHAVAEWDQVNATSKIEILSLAGADINARELGLGNTVLHIAANTRNYSLAEWICQKPGASLGAINFEHDTAYHLAYKAGDVRMMELLRNNGAVCDDPRADPDEASESIDLALSFASKMFRSNILSVGSKNENRENVLHFLCRTGDVTDLLFFHDLINDENRYCLSEYNNERQQCVHVVASEQKDAVEKMKLLALWGADLNGKELKYGGTPLHIAVKASNYRLAEWLCQQPSVNKEALNDNLMTAYHIAFFGRDYKMMDLLKQNGVQCRVPMQSEANSVDEGYEPPCKVSKNQT